MLGQCVQGFLHVAEGVHFPVVRAQYPLQCLEDLRFVVQQLDFDHGVVSVANVASSAVRTNRV
ncbi:hypothetical protein D3C87_2162340 [compost metagenome]